MRAIASKKVDLVAEPLVEMLRPFIELVFTIKADNRKEFTKHEKKQKLSTLDFVSPIRTAYGKNRAMKIQITSFGSTFLIKARFVSCTQS
ncbi:MAG: hypothetical protein D6767_01845 [Candidatus Hydrogenedentota bacterium]|nr:MAG: hypothetical protein D6767_01845 [Candidatus Hydrogenedentota bacterium]